MAGKGKRLRTARAQIEVDRSYSVTEAVDLVKKNATARFDETVEIAVNLGIDTRQSDQNVRGVVQLPHGTGKSVRVCVFAKGDKIKEAEAAGADMVGGEEVAAAIEKGDATFDSCIATPDMMVVVGKLGKVLGPRGLMPNPKLGTVTMDVKAAVEAAKSGQITFRAEKAGLIHAGVGKASFDTPSLVANIRAFADALVKAKPSGAKGTYFKRAVVSSTMGPGVTLDITNLVVA